MTTWICCRCKLFTNFLIDCALSLVFNLHRSCIKSFRQLNRFCIVQRVSLWTENSSQIKLGGRFFVTLRFKLQNQFLQYFFKFFFALGHLCIQEQMSRGGSGSIYINIANHTVLPGYKINCLDHKMIAFKFKCFKFLHFFS